MRSMARSFGTPAFEYGSADAPALLAKVRELEPDLMICQANAILTQDLIDIPRIGCLNRHGSLLPEYRGRLAPFWAYLRGEREIGLSIHFVDKEIDNGPILVQKRIAIGRFDSVPKLIEKMFAQAPNAMLEALDMIRSGEYREKMMSNDAGQATYFSSPTVRDAMAYRVVQIKRWFGG